LGAAARDGGGGRGPRVLRVLARLPAAPGGRGPLRPALRPRRSPHPGGLSTRCRRGPRYRRGNSGGSSGSPLPHHEPALGPMRLSPLALLLLLAPTAAAQPVYDTADPMPVLRGGVGALQSAIVSPDEARAQGLSGRVLVSFVVDAEGRVAEAAVLRGAHPLLDAAALDAVRQARFEPGRRGGVPVAIRMVLPISFALSAEAREEAGEGGPGTEVAVQVDEMPRVIGGLDAVAERVVYPPEAEAAGIEGRVFVMFVVDA